MLADSVLGCLQIALDPEAIRVTPEPYRIEFVWPDPAPNLVNGQRIPLRAAERREVDYSDVANGDRLSVPASNTPLSTHVGGSAREQAAEQHKPDHPRCRFRFVHI
jgi:hypothetical protein